MDLTRFKGYLKALIEEIKPDLKSYMQLSIRAKVVACHYEANNYTVDVQPLKRDLSVDETRPIIKEVPLSTRWGSASEALGIFCQPKVGTVVRVDFYDGDPNDPYVDDVISGASPALEEGEARIKADKLNLNDGTQGVVRKGDKTLGHLHSTTGGVCPYTATTHITLDTNTVQDEADECSGTVKAG